MSYPYVFLFSVENEDCGKVVAVVAMSEEEAWEEIRDEYSSCDIKILKDISVQTIGTMKEIYRFDK